MSTTSPPVVVDDFFCFDEDDEYPDDDDVLDRKRCRSQFEEEEEEDYAFEPVPLYEPAPTLIFPFNPKRLRLEDGEGDDHNIVVDEIDMPYESSDLIRMVPEEVLGQVVSYLGHSVRDRFSLQATCKLFQRLSNSVKIVKSLCLSGDSMGRYALIRNSDSIESAIRKTTYYARMGNVEGLYFLGIIKTFCTFEDVEGGILILKRAADEGHVQAHYTLGLVLRDSNPLEAQLHMKVAEEMGYLPALQEVWNNRDLKSKFGDLTAEDLKPFMDCPSLSNLLKRHYLESAILRQHETSHCWNANCGKWAFKGVPNPGCLRVARMKMCSRCCRAKYCCKLCQVEDWRSGRHKNDCQYLT